MTEMINRMLFTISYIMKEFSEPKINHLKNKLPSLSLVIQYSSFCFYLKLQVTLQTNKNERENTGRLWCEYNRIENLSVSGLKIITCKSITW